MKWQSLYVPLAHECKSFFECISLPAGNSKFPAGYNRGIPAMSLFLFSSLQRSPIWAASLRENSLYFPCIRTGVASCKEALVPSRLAAKPADFR